MRKKSRPWIGIEALESRTLLSGWNLGAGFGSGFGGHSGGHSGGGNTYIGGIRIPRSALSDPTVQADIAQLKIDKAQLQSDLLASKDAIRADQKAIRDAIAALAPQLQ